MDDDRDDGAAADARETRRARGARIDFSPDPRQLMAALEQAVVSVAGGGVVQPAALPSHVFRLLRPDDLAVFDVLAWDLELEAVDEQPMLIPIADGARLEVRFAFQHLGEQAFYKETEQPVPVPPQDEVPLPPPIKALAAKGSRLVYDVPLDERISYDIEGVLAAMSRLPLRVAPLATPRAATVRPGRVKAGDLLGLIALPGGFLLGRTDDGRLALATAAGRRPSSRVVEEPVASRRVLAKAIALRSARTLLADETAIDLADAELSRVPLDPAAVRAEDEGLRINPRLDWRAIGDFIVGPLLPIRPRITQRPRAPRTDETAIEAPFRLIVSPSAQGGFAHSLLPAAAPSDDSRVELWHTRLGVRKVDAEDGAVSIDESRHPQRIVRAVWARDLAGLPADTDPPNNNLPFRMSLTARDRAILVRQTSDPKLAPPKPVDVERLHLSSLGAWLALHAQWIPEELFPYASVPGASKPIQSWDHLAPMGRDGFVQVVYPGYFFPLGHLTTLVKQTERKILEPGDPKAYLYQKKFLQTSQLVKAYDDRRLPFRQITLSPHVTPNIADPLKPGTPGVLAGEDLFWPIVNGAKFYFTLECIDRRGVKRKFQAPLLFVGMNLPQDAAGVRESDIRAAYAADPESPIKGNAQVVAYANPAVPGDTEFESITLRLDATLGPQGKMQAFPFMKDADVIVPAMRHLAPAAPPAQVKYAQAYIADEFGGKNSEAQLFLELVNPQVISFSSGTDRSGGFVQPDLPVRGLSRVLGTVGEVDDIVNAPAASKFNPTKYLAGVLPKLFGLFELTDILQVLGLDAAPTFITEQLDRISALIADLEAMKEVVTRSAARLADDAVGAATQPLRDQAQQAQAAIDAVRAQLEPLVDQLVAAIESLMALGTPSSVADVTAAVAALLDAIRAQLDALRSVVRERPLPPPVKAELERLLDTLQPVLDAATVVDTIDAIAQFVNGLDPSGLGVRAKFDWRPKLTNFPNGPASDALFVVREDGFLLSVEARASGQDGVGVDALAELREFSLNLFPTAPLMRLGFDRLAFRAASGRKPEVDVVFRGIEFLGVLSFIETLKDLIPFDGFSDPPYVDVSAEGVTAGFSLSLPSTAIGVFSLENISFGADARVPFLGNEALTIGFNFCTREKPFRLTVMMIGGGGFVAIRLSPKGLVVLEMALEAGASLSVNLGVASGSVSVMVGVYLKLEADKGQLTGYFRIRGEVDVLGLISASITLELSLTYEFATGKLVGRASIEIEVEVFFFSFSVTVSCERRLAGSNGDPTFEQVMGLLADGSSPNWAQYCAAFAEA